MLQQIVDDKPNVRIGDMAAMMRLMGPLHGPIPDPVESRRRLVADLCRFIGVKIGMLSAGALPDPAQPILPGVAAEPGPPPLATEPGEPELSPRLAQTLQLLLKGDSEKQVALKLKLSRNTVHVYVKALYLRYEVGTRAELLARHLKR